VAGKLLQFLGLALPVPSRPEMIGVWLLFAGAGYIQWFVVISRMQQWWRNARRYRHPDMM
jgi:hypothetical protein